MHQRRRKPGRAARPWCPGRSAAQARSARRRPRSRSPLLGRGVHVLPLAGARPLGQPADSRRRAGRCESRRGRELQSGSRLGARQSSSLTAIVSPSSRCVARVDQSAQRLQLLAAAGMAAAVMPHTVVPGAMRSANAKAVRIVCRLRLSSRGHIRCRAVTDRLVVRGAREHNLRNISLDLPRDALIVFTGLSGSGKSSLAFDTIFAEGQRRYVESLSAYARQFLGQMDKPDVDFIEGLSPAVSIDQKSTSPQPALDGRHHHRGLRLPPPALRPRRPAALPDLRRADQPAVAAADRRPAAGARGGHPLPGAGPGDPGPQGRVRRAVPPARRPRASAGPGSTARSCQLTEPPTLDKKYKHTIEVVVDRLAVKADRQAAAHRLGRDRAAAWRRAS